MIILDDLSPFFLNGDGRSLSRMQNCGGSWLEKIGRVVGVPKLTVTHLRRAAENLIQKSQDLRDRSKSLNAHFQKCTFSAKFFSTLWAFLFM